MTSATEIGVLRWFAGVLVWHVRRALGVLPDRPKACQHARYQRVAWPEVLTHLVVAPWRGNESWIETTWLRVACLVTSVITSISITCVLIIIVVT